MRFPNGARFAFSIFDDTDVATVENVRPIYDLLSMLGMRTTKTVWPFAWNGENSNFASSETLEDPDYLSFVSKLAALGFEIASHGATMETSNRQTTILAHERLREVFGAYPRAYANHSWNRENLYWGTDRIDLSWLRWLYGRYLGLPQDFYLGHIPDSPLWWGDLCAARHDYVRNLTFNSLNALSVNPTMPYHDPRRPLVKWWFSATDAENCDEFIDRMHPRAIDELEADGGVCIIATHLGKGFCTSGSVHPAVERILRGLSSRNGWFAPVSAILDHLLLESGNPEPCDRTIPSSEWRRVQIRWARDLVLRRLPRRLGRLLA